MKDREKLIELLKMYAYGPLGSAEYIAENLISNGVTVQKWIPVSERLPDEPMEYIVMIKGAENATTLLFDGVSWFWEEYNGYNTYYSVTHWMPLPEPPKED